MTRGHPAWRNGRAAVPTAALKGETRNRLLRSRRHFIPVSKRLLKPADKHAPCLFIRAGKEGVVDVQEQARRVVVPIEVSDLFTRKPGWLGRGKVLCAGCGQDETLIQFRSQDLWGIDDPVQPRREPLHGGLFAMDQKHLMPDRQPLLDPVAQLGAVGVTGVEVK